MCCELARPPNLDEVATDAKKLAAMERKVPHPASVPCEAAKQGAFRSKKAHRPPRTPTHRHAQGFRLHGHRKQRSTKCGVRRCLTSFPSSILARLTPPLHAAAGAHHQSPARKRCNGTGALRTSVRAATRPKDLAPFSRLSWEHRMECGTFRCWQLRNHVATGSSPHDIL